VPTPSEESSHAQRARHIEALGLALIVLIILISLLVRFAHTAPWSWR
jgi:hypothetical protein